MVLLTKVCDKWMQYTVILLWSNCFVIATVRWVEWAAATMLMVKRKKRYHKKRYKNVTVHRDWSPDKIHVFLSACTCLYNGKTYPYGSIIYNTTDGIGNCIEAVCGVNGDIGRIFYICPTTTTTEEPTTTTPVTITTASSTTTVSTTLRPTTIFTFSTPGKAIKGIYYFSESDFKVTLS